MRMRAKTLSPTMTRRVRIPVPDAPSPLEGISARGPVKVGYGEYSFTCFGAEGSDHVRSDC